jgi:hypothetical protein
MAQVVEQLPSKQKTHSSTASIATHTQKKTIADFDYQSLWVLNV